jgi:hypothetical protein
MAPSPAAVLRSPPIQFFPFFLLSAVKRDKVLFSALKSFPEDLQSCPSPDFTECLTTIIQHLSLGSIKYHARAQSQITPNWRNSEQVKSCLRGQTSTTLLSSGVSADIEIDRFENSSETWNATSNTSYQFQPYKYLLDLVLD